ncbi:MAG: hypothetical protein JWM14_1497 [Chitinophagaceae bacterium]|nr:hypothetical protein [Chitinophagaceae bacterium]
MTPSNNKAIENMMKMQKAFSKTNEMFAVSNAITKLSKLYPKHESALDKAIKHMKAAAIHEDISRSLLWQKTFFPSGNADPAESINVVEEPRVEYEEEINQRRVVDSIISRRDYVNAIFNRKYGCKLLFHREDRSLLNLSKTAKTEEQFATRMGSLAGLVTSINMDVLRPLIAKGTKNGSINYLQAYLAKIGILNGTIIDTLRAIGYVRNGYPMHSDNADLFIGLEHFGIEYPIEDYNKAWKKILAAYKKALDELVEAVKQDQKQQSSNTPQ